MCGIIGYTGHRPAVPIILEGLGRLEYRGYDSAGVAYIQNGELVVVRAQGKLVNLEDKLASTNISISTCGMGHTRWATHGVPAERNAHPHQAMQGDLAIVHNGIIENFETLRSELTAKGYSFTSETDTEVLANLIHLHVEEQGDTLKGLASALKHVEGAYAVVLVDSREPETVYGCRVSSPLVMGVGQGENFLGSDIPAFLPYTRKVVFLEDGEIVRLTPNAWDLMDRDLNPVSREPQTITWNIQAAQKGGHKHFMIKEIFEQPRVITDCLAGRIRTGVAGNEAVLPELDGLETPERLHIVACGTSYHAGLWGMHLLESWAGIPVSVEIASEFRYRDALLGPKDAVLVISQSGETADTLAGLRKVKSMGVPVIGLCNVVGSGIARESDVVVYTQAGPEISVASTKAMCSQLTLLTLMALYWGVKRGRLPEDIRREALASLVKLPAIIEGELPAMRDRAQQLAYSYSSSHSFLYLGRGHCFPLALEGALKLKEISYIHAEGYAAGEMKHGPIALIDPDFPTFALALDDELFPKVKSNLEEIQARQGKIIALHHPGTDLAVDDLWTIPKVWGPLNAFVALPALQLFAYETADYLGKDVDQPRNLAKSVTVE